MENQEGTDFPAEVCLSKSSCYRWMLRFNYSLLQIIKSNWNNGMCVQEYFDCPMSYYNMKMDDKRIVMFEKGWGHFKVFNRQKLNLLVFLTVNSILFPSQT